MANALYDLWKQDLLKGIPETLLASPPGVTGVYVALIDTGAYTFSQLHKYYSDLSGIVGTDQEILLTTQVNGVFDGSDVVFPTVTGNSCEALVIYRRSAGPTNEWPLVAYIDTGVTNLPVTPNGGDITITWDATGIFKL